MIADVDYQQRRTTEMGGHGSIAFHYRQRQSAPTGTPWHDFCIRIGNIDTPLYTVMVLRGVGIGEFQSKDEAAVAVATIEQAQRRKGLEREAQKQRGVPRF